jgi:hypothetical protein
VTITKPAQKQKYNLKQYKYTRTKGAQKTTAYNIKKFTL